MFCSSCGSGLERNFNFCPSCGERTTFSSTACETISVGAQSDAESEREAIESYFYAGYEYETILAFLSKHHGISMSMSTIKRRLNHYQLKIRNSEEVKMMSLWRLSEKSWTDQAAFQGIEHCGTFSDSIMGYAFHKLVCKNY